MSKKRVSFFKNPALVSGMIGLAGVVLFLAGCAAPNAQKRIAAFSTALSIATTNTTEAFETVDQKFYRTKVALLVNNYDEKGFNPNTEMHFLTGQDLAVREQLFKGLQRYAQKLADIMSDAQLKEFDAETKAFGKSLQKLSENDAFKNINSGASKANIDAFVTAVDVVGRFFIDYKRERGVREIVADMKQPIENICNTLISDIGQPMDKTGAGGFGLRNQSWIQYDVMLKEHISFIDRNKDKFDPVTKAEAIAKLPAIVEEQSKADLTLKATQDTLKKLRMTHDELVKAFDKTCPTLENLIAELIDEGKRVGKFYKSLAKE
ncbi:MAG: hypothetical protein DCC43_15990 [Candidatus Brocadia sp.]|uniref:DUF3829 domain-containing protein n=1 Tax=Candidatus Brocadia fulgida TaxID=380242 RepID=A0A0M2UR14_9BACT|nr:MAG: hypothetical protein BROFUL_02798 [Candidatus Brocadia fulgida]MCC6325681.1 hypothetical protein [Candidatus Brocadia sp.]MCE7912202.1 hypothetical protein [Candidatus Brocadia sp. AMX3]MBV6518163.1 hypothetical protein [Candidatus Brocadia fulgida]MDG5997779.1 hypothetical protein [Candidatus Brocadia sp.]